MPVRFSSGMDHQGTTVWILELYYRRLVISLAALAVAGYFLGVTALYFWLEGKPHNQVGWTDLAAPWRWSGLDKKRGDAVVLTALDDLKDRNYGNAYYQLRAGLARSPGNAAGRLALAKLLMNHDPVRALAVMEEGIPSCVHDEKFVEGLLAIYAAQQIQGYAVEVIGRMLSTTPSALSPAARVKLERARFGFLLALGRDDEAEVALEALRTSDAAGAPVRDVEWQLHRQRAEEAGRIFDRHFADRLSDPEISRLAIDVAVALEDAERLQRVARRLKVRFPENHGIYLQLIQGWQRLKRLSFRDATEQEYYQLFAQKEIALQSLAALAVHLELPEMLARTQRVAVANKFSAFAFRVHQTELALRRRDLDQAMRSLGEWEKGIDTLPAGQRFYPEFIKRLTRACFTGAADQSLSLLNHLGTNRGPARLSMYAFAAERLMQSGDTLGAGQVVEAARTLYPRSDLLLELRRKLDPQIAASAVTSQTVASVAASALVLPATAKEAQQQLEILFQQEAWGAARDWLRAIRAQAPAWLASIETEVSWREVELAYRTLDPLASRSAARVYLDRYRGEEEVLALVAVAARLRAQERVTEARLLKDEIAAAGGTMVRVQAALQALDLPDDLAADTATAARAGERLEQAIAGQDWAQAERLLKYVREKAPAWAADAAVEWKVAEVQIRLGLEQKPLALAALKDLVNKGGVARGAAFKLVRTLVGREEFDRAQLLAREINRLMPDDPAAQRLLKETTVPSL